MHNRVAVNWIVLFCFPFFFFFIFFPPPFVILIEKKMTTVGSSRNVIIRNFKSALDLVYDGFNGETERKV